MFFCEYFILSPHDRLEWPGCCTRCAWSLQPAAPAHRAAPQPCSCSVAALMPSPLRWLCFSLWRHILLRKQSLPSMAPTPGSGGNYSPRLSEQMKDIDFTSLVSSDDDFMHLKILWTLENAVMMRKSHSGKQDNSGVTRIAEASVTQTCEEELLPLLLYHLGPHSLTSLSLFLHLWNAYPLRLLWGPVHSA